MSECTPIAEAVEGVLRTLLAHLDDATLALLRDRYPASDPTGAAILDELWRRWRATS